MSDLEIGVLGPLEVWRDSRSVPIGGKKPKIVLASLVVSLNHAVPMDGLAAAVWGDDPPESGVDTLQSILSRLRSGLGHDTIQLTDHSYRLVLEPEAVDAIRFERLLAQATSRLGDEPQEAATLARRGLDLWRGTPFGDLRDVAALEQEVRRLDALRVSALEIRLEADIACGLLPAAIASLEAEVTENPFRERLWYLLILALARDGRRVEALRAGQRLRAILADTGLEPSAEIRELEELVLEEAPEVRSHFRH